MACGDIQLPSVQMFLRVQQFRLRIMRHKFMMYTLLAYGNSMVCRCGTDKRWIYAVWTVSFLEPVHITASNLIDNMSESEPIQLSGETVFAMERSGLVCDLFLFFSFSFYFSVSILPLNC